jgi:hypothetical protein
MVYIAFKLKNNDLEIRYLVFALTISRRRTKNALETQNHIACQRRQQMLTDMPGAAAVETSYKGPEISGRQK